MKNFRLYLSLGILLPIMVSAQWSQSPTPNSSRLTHVYFLNDSIGHCGDPYSAFATTDGGLTWQVDTSAYANFKNAIFTDHLNGFAISDSNLFQSNDGGATWVNISDSVEITNFLNLATKNGHVIINGFKQQDGYYWYATVNNGQSWETRNQHPSRNPLVSFVLDENHFFLSDSHNRILATSSDGGFTWNSTSIGDGGVHRYITSIFFISPDTGFVGIDGHYGGGHIERSINGIYGFGLPPNIVPNITHPVYFVNGYNDVVCGGGGDGNFYCSPNRGDVWFFQNNPVTNPAPFFDILYASYFHDENRIAVVGGNGRVLITQTGVEHNLSNSVFEEFTSEVSIFPNPFSQTTSIERSKGNISQIRITNAAGQICLVKTDIQDSRFQISRSELPRAGLYFVEIFADNMLVERKKLMLVE